MRCEGCFREIKDDAKFCPFCGEEQKNKVEKEVKPAETVAIKPAQYGDNVYVTTTAKNETVYTTTTESNANNSFTQALEQPVNQGIPKNPWMISKLKQAIWFGIFAILISLILNSFFLILSATLAITAISLGITYRKHDSRKATWGIILGTLGLLITIVSGMIFIDETIKASKLDEKYSDELNMEIPNKSPEYFYFYNYVGMSGHEVQYLYTEEEMNDFLIQINNNSNWQSVRTDSISNLLNHFEIEIEDNAGYYLVYDYKTYQYVAPYNFEDFHFLLVYFDLKEDRVLFIELWD